MLATVRDQSGRIVKGLSKDDFRLEEDGLPQTIRYFERETDLPLTVGLVVDTSSITADRRGDERRDCHRFLRQVLRPDRDGAFLIQFYRSVELLQDVTSSRRLLDAAVDKMRTPIPLPFKRVHRDHVDRNECGSAVLPMHDALYLGSAEILQPRQGRKALVLVGSGLDGGSCTSPALAVETAQRADSSIYGVLIMERVADRIARREGRITEFRGKLAMEHLAKQTGGRFFDPGLRGSLQQSFELIEEDLRNQYRIGYSPERTKPGFHETRLTTKAAGCVVRAREGYYSD